jgi:hypothetical protein
MTEPTQAPDTVIREELARHGVEAIEITRRAFADEVNFIVYVASEDVPQAAMVGNSLDQRLSTEAIRTFVIVRVAPPALQPPSSATPVRMGVHDSRATDLIRLISARSRVSLAQPSLAYVQDTQATLVTVTAARHHLIFGRRGAGKTALLVEAQRQVDGEGAISCWINIQSLRNEKPARVVLYVLDELLGAVMSRRRVVSTESAVTLDLSRTLEAVRALLEEDDSSSAAVRALVPRIQRALRHYLELEGARVYVFLDDFYYLARADQPGILDQLHACIRDADVWLKIASIRHLTRWFQSSPPLGLQTTHDASLLDLDVTLQDPRRATEFLANVLLQYARRVGVSGLNRMFSPEALDRLVLASGAVPRDYLSLASSAVAKAQQRQNARLVGVQDVNQAAGDAAGAKLQELEDDMASNVGTAERTLATLQRVRNFCLEEMKFTYFLVDYRDKESQAACYGLLTDLMDVRLIHLLDAGVSDPHAAGKRSEAFMLDLSQFSGSRLMQGIHVLDFVGGRIVARQTRTSQPKRVGNTPRQVNTILRAAPTYVLRTLKDLTNHQAAKGQPAVIKRGGAAKAVRRS